MKQMLIIAATIALPADPLAASKLQTAALEAGEVFKKAIQGVEKKAEYEAKVSRVREENDPKVTRKTKTPAAEAPKPQDQE